MRTRTRATHGTGTAIAAAMPFGAFALAVSLAVTVVLTGAAEATERSSSPVATALQIAQTTDTDAADETASEETVPEDAAADEATAEDAASDEETASEDADEAAGEDEAASLAPAVLPEGTVQVMFPEGSDEVPEEALDALNQLAARMQADPAMRLQLLAYATGPEDAVSRIKRLSLSRALNIRRILGAAGIASTRIDALPLGNEVDADRVDIVPTTL